MINKFKPSIYALLSNLFICVFVSGLAMAQTTSTSTSTSTGNANVVNETHNNLILSTNAANSKPKDTFLNLNTNGGTTATSATNLNLTDAQKQLSTNYVNQGMANQIIKDKCSGDENQQICSGQDANSSKTGMVNAVAKAYAMMGSMAGDDFLPLYKKPTTGSGDAKQATDTKPADPSKEKQDKQSDYCKYIPAMTETVATFQQQSTANQLSQGTPAGQTAQYDTLMKAAKNHEDRAKGAQIQEAGWYGGAACYTIMAATGGVTINTGLVVKLGASFFLGNFYQSEVDTNNGYAEKTKAIANSLPKAGDCNPVTQTDCFCNQPSAPTSDPGNYATYCQAQIKQKALEAAAAAHGTCVNNMLAADPTCACASTNTCASQLITSQDTGNLLGFGSANSPFSTVRNLGQGQFQNGTLNGSSFAQSKAIASKNLNDIAGKFNLNDGNLSPSERAQAKIYQDSGIPANIAAAMAKASVSKGAMDSALAKVSGAAAGANPVLNAAFQGNNNHSIDFSGGSGLGTKGRSGNGNKSDDFLGKFNIGKKDAGNSKVVEFAVQKAQMQNQITKTDSSIFEIISNRYSSSGRRLLQVEEQN